MGQDKYPISVRMYRNADGVRRDWPAEQWWKRYQDPTLDQLIELAVGSSPSLATAHARYDSARQSVRIAGAASGVRVDANAEVGRQRLSDNGLIPPQFRTALLYLNISL